MAYTNIHSADRVVFCEHGPHNTETFLFGIITERHDTIYFQQVKTITRRLLHTPNVICETVVPIWRKFGKKYIISKGRGKYNQGLLYLRNYRRVTIKGSMQHIPTFYELYDEYKRYINHHTYE
jgi:hypothetical protein